MYSTLNEIALKTNLIFENEDKLCEKDILNIFNSNNPDLSNFDLNNGIILNWIGLYYQYYNKNTDLMKKYYLMGIDINNIGCMMCMGQYYREIKDYENMINYYKIAIDNECFQAMYILGKYYFDMQNFNESYKYFNMIHPTIMNKIKKNEIILKSLDDKINIFKCKINFITMLIESNNYFSEITKIHEIVNNGEIGWINKNTIKSLNEIKNIFRTISLNFD